MRTTEWCLQKEWSVCTRVIVVLKNKNKKAIHFICNWTQEVKENIKTDCDSSVKFFVAPEKAACKLINCLAGCHSVAKLHYG